MIGFFCSLPLTLKYNTVILNLFQDLTGQIATMMQTLHVGCRNKFGMTEMLLICLQHTRTQILIKGLVTTVGGILNRLRAYVVELDIPCWQGRLRCAVTINKTQYPGRAYLA